MRTVNLLLFFLISLHVCSAQIQVKGVVLDENKQYVEGASVFLNNTSYTTLTDSIGGFSLDGASGDYQLIAHKEGFEITFIKINRSGKVKLVLQKTVEKQEQKVKYSDTEREQYLKTFQFDFLGRSRNAENCIILNPEVIHFEVDLMEQALKATASAPILIRNYKLGYDLTYHLQAYERNMSTTSYVGYVSFQRAQGLEIKPKHVHAREKAYLGSIAHFLRSVLAGKHNREGYRLQTATLVGNDWLWKEIPISDLAVYNEEGVFLFGSGKFRIIYLPERREYNYVRWLKANGIKEIGRGQYSEMEFASQKVKILPSGSLEPPLGLVFRGYMGWEQVGDALPVNYRP